MWKVFLQTLQTGEKSRNTIAEHRKVLPTPSWERPGGLLRPSAPSICVTPAASVQPELFLQLPGSGG